MISWTKSIFSIALMSAMGLVSAQSKFPDGTIKLIVPFAAGGGVDNAARLIAKQMQSSLMFARKAEANTLD